MGFSVYTMKLRYGETLLALLRREVARPPILGGPNIARVVDVCERFERLMAAVCIAPLVWEGDYA